MTVDDFKMAVAKKNPQVSVCVVAFNHEKYIRQCLASIVSQRCGFDFEILVRDDCSSDGTLEIIQEFCEYYPGLVRLIPAENNINANRGFLELFKESSADYIAMCEGDDYWVSDEKLQMQYDAIKNNPGAMFCSCACYLHGESGIGDVRYLKGTDLIVKTGVSDVLGLNGSFAPTASYFFDKKIVDSLPEWFADAPVGDLFIELYSLLSGGVHINLPLCVYRVFSVGSWSSRQKSNYDYMLENSIRLAQFLSIVAADDRFGKYDFSKRISECYFNASYASLHAGYEDLFAETITLSWKFARFLTRAQIVLYLLRRFPKGGRFLYFIKSKILYFGN